MKNRSPARHAPEKIKAALAKMEAGKSLTDVAAELGVSKSLVAYWRSHAERLLADPAAGQATRKPAKADAPTLAFIEKCWTSIGLAFKRLDAELKSGEKPQGVRDLALCIAVLADKLAQARQNIESRAAPASTGWSVSEDTWLLLRRHREAQAEPVAQTPSAKSEEVGQKASRLEPQKGAAPDEPSAASSPADGGASSGHVRVGGQ